MRVITGSAKGRKLQMVPGEGTRPITDRAKSALFSILSDSIKQTRVLDLFGGTGAVGIEALSRGADFAQFVDLDRKAVETIWANLRHCRLDKRAAVQQGDSFLFLQRYHGAPFELVYVAPPQYQGLWRKALEAIDSRPELLAQYGAVVVQIHPKEETALALQHLEEYDRRKYGSVLLLFYANAKDLNEMERDDAENELESLETAEGVDEE
jgi:16S rRNA (guanine(966)-N(2))-methyltransferase RsmD